MADIQTGELELGRSCLWTDPSTANLPYNSLQPLALGTLMRGRYRVVSQLGKGGMSHVYLVQDENVDARPLRSMKEMIPRLDDTQHQAYMLTFKREADVLETLRHSNIPRVYDSFTEFCRAYLVLDYVEGQDLEQVLGRTPGLLSPQVVGSWMIQLCTIVEYLHSHRPPIIFRDLKPSNVILTPDQRIILIDFGIAKVFVADEKQTNVGTQGYAAREQYRGEAEIRSDVYALGAMLHHLLTKTDPGLQPPFSFHERPPSQLNPAVGTELEHVIMRCLEDDRDKRYQTVSELRIALEDALHLTDTDTDADTTYVRTLAKVHSIPVLAHVLDLSAVDGADVVTLGSLGDADDTGRADNAHANTAKNPYDTAGAEGAAAADTPPGKSLATHVPRCPEPSVRVGARPERQGHTHRRQAHRLPAMWTIVLLSALVLLVTGAAIGALAPRSTVQIVLVPLTTSTAFASSHASSRSSGGSTPGGASGTGTGGASRVNGTSAGPLSTTAPQSSMGTPVPTTTPLAVPTATWTPALAPPILSVSPTAITLSTCLAITQTQFTVANTGGSSLSWTASATGSGYQLSPASGSIASGEQSTVTVSNILLSGSVTVSAPGAQHSPQRVSITCTV